MATRDTLARFAELQADAQQQKKFGTVRGGPDPGADNPLEARINVTPYRFSDADFVDLALEHGLKICACTFDRLDPTQDYPLSAFSPENHFAHIAFRKFKILTPDSVI